MNIHESTPVDHTWNIKASAALWKKLIFKSLSTLWYIHSLEPISPVQNLNPPTHFPTPISVHQYFTTLRNRDLEAPLSAIYIEGFRTLQWTALYNWTIRSSVIIKSPSAAQSKEFKHPESKSLKTWTKITQAAQLAATSAINKLILRSS
jgi:hypothetical protein